MVIDSNTGKPMEGAFVLAVYNESGGTLFGHSSSWCVRTKGVWTGADGRFTFPKGKPNNPHLYAVKEGYVLNSYREPSPRREGEKPAEFRYLYLDRHGESKIKSSQFIICERPSTRQDADANITYLKLLSKESEHMPNGDVRISAIKSMMDLFDALPDVPPR